MKTMRPVGLMLLLTLSACGLRNATTQVSSDSWREDLRYLARELPTQHANAFHDISREAFAGEVARLDAAQYHRFGADADSAVIPDRQIEPTWAEFRAGRDPVLEWILSQ